jgi:hypothetical protein
VGTLLNKWRLYFTDVTGKSNLLLLIRYPFLAVKATLQLLVIAIVNVTKSLLVLNKVTNSVVEALLRLSVYLSWCLYPC